MALKYRMGQVSWRKINSPPCGGPGTKQEHYKEEEISNERGSDQTH